MPDTGSKKKRPLDEDSDFKARKRLRLPICEGPIFTSEPVKVVVGTSKTTYFVDEAQLRASSDFFNRVFDGNWQESAARTVTLSEVTPRAFNIYAKWLYSGCFYTTEPDDRIIHDSDIEYFKFGECYQLADFLQATDFKDACIDFIINKMIVQNIVFRGIATNVYAYSLESSPHRQFTVDCALNFWNKESFELLIGQKSPKEFQDDLMVALGSHLRDGLKLASPKEYFKSIDTCRYHEHVGNGKPCYKTRYKHLP